MWRGLSSVDANATVSHVEIRLLQSIPIFSRLPAPQLEGLARALVSKTYSSGSVVIREGEKSDFYFAIANGEVQIQYLGETVSHLTRGEGFGEIALIKDIPSMVTVLTTRETKICCLQKESFILALQGIFPLAMLPLILLYNSWTDYEPLKSGKHLIKKRLNRVSLFYILYYKLVNCFF